MHMVHCLLNFSRPRTLGRSMERPWPYVLNLISVSSLISRVDVSRVLRQFRQVEVICYPHLERGSAQ